VIRRVVSLVLVLGLAACGDDLVPQAPDGGAPDGGAAADAGADAAPDAGVDAAVDAAPIPAPAITDVTVDGISDREVRHGATVELTVTGTGLDAVRFARVAGADADILERTATGLHLRVQIPHGHPPGDAALEVDGAGGIARFDRAIRVTPVVIAPGGRPDGRGTYTSPMALCRDDFPQLLDRTDVLELSAGTHLCEGDVAVPRGVIVRGAGRDRTIVRGRGSRGFEGFRVYAGFWGTTVFRDLTIEDATYIVIWLFHGDLEVIDVDMRRAHAVGVYVYSGGTATVTRLRYQEGWNGVMVVTGAAEVTDSYLGGAGQSIRCAHLDSGTLRLVDTVLENCGKGVTAGSENDVDAEVRTVELVRTHVSKSWRGIDAYGADLRVVDSDLVGYDDAYVGVYVDGGRAEIRGSRIRDWDTGIDLSTFGHEVAGVDGTVSGLLDSVEIDARWTGVELTPYYDPGHLTMRRTRASARQALRIWGSAALVDLGTAASPGENQLSVLAAADVAIADDRDAAGVPIDAHGTRLNDTAYEGTVTGPASVPGAYRLSAGNIIRF
jgi:hypothetical protein